MKQNPPRKRAQTPLPKFQLPLPGAPAGRARTGTITLPVYQDALALVEHTFLVEPEVPLVFLSTPPRPHEADRAWRI